jgi:MYXO-CTERM domain-containing protein
MACIGLLTLAPALVHAHALEPRTAVDWTGAPCLTTIDRSQTGPIHLLDYAIPNEDLPLPDIEPIDGRSHQFFVFCRDHQREDVLPNWINDDDVKVAVHLGLGDVSLIEPERDILVQNDAWAGCWTAINADDARRPITFAAAAEPLQWDTSALAAGTYVVEAYTWDPWFNLWTEHPGVFRIVDDPDPAANPPAAALTHDDQAVAVGEAAHIEGCVEAMPGSTMTLSWALAGTSEPPVWHVAAADLPVESGRFALELPGPEAVAGRFMLVALEVVDPQGRSWTAHGDNYIGVLETPSPGESEGGESEGGESEGGESDAGSEGANHDEAGTSEEGPAFGESAGCACSFGEHAPASPVAGLLAAWLVAGRRRRTQSV